MKFKKPKFWDNPNLTFFAILLFPISLIYYLISVIVRLKESKKFSVPVICVGNIYLGGTGKTPLALEIFSIVKSLGKKPGFIKKYYNYLNDEIKMLKKNGDTFVHKKRDEAMNMLIQNKNDLAILDDGFQDQSIKKDFTIVCFNSKQWIGNGLLIPSGPLRENLQKIKGVDCIFINGDKDLKIENEIFNKISKDIRIFYSKYKILDIERFKNKNFIAFAGIGNPSNFFELLNENNINVIKKISFPDHYYYTDRKFEQILEMAKKIKANLITTEKDYERMNNEQRKNCDYLKVKLDIKDKSQFINLIKNKI